MATKSFEKSDAAGVITPAEVWKVGELARQTGLTERTLRYYDQIGLLRPSLRSDAGYRLYTAGDIARLQQIRSLRQLGLSLDEVHAWLDRPGFSPLEAVERQLEQLRAQIALEHLLADRLEALATWLRVAKQPPARLLLNTIEVMMNVDYNKYYTPEQLEEIKRRGEQIGPERIHAVEAEWPKLIAEVRAEMEAGTDPADPKVQALARRWQGLLAEFTGGNPAIQNSLNQMWAQEPALGQMTGIDEKLSAYIKQMMAAAR
ncbi:MAG TPA: MerR family transcriptional regulator [Anaerolineae bacterium]